jgi:hypothetical protein
MENKIMDTKGKQIWKSGYNQAIGDAASRISGNINLADANNIERSVFELAIALNVKAIKELKK